MVNRKRIKKSDASKKSSASSQPVNGGTGIAAIEGDEETLFRVFFEHPLIKVGKFILGPYALYLGYFFLFLQHPAYLVKASWGMIQLRPATLVDDPRQFLIVGPQSSGTSQVSTELQEKLKLEVGHETTDTHWSFVRDGTVSWFHATRFLDHPDITSKLKSIDSICHNGGEHMHMGFHPAAYRPPSKKCSYRSKWDKCWESECVLILLQEWGCALNDTCEINFSTSLHQVRNPLRTIESLAVKFCVGGPTGNIAKSFLVYASAMFPHHDFSQDSCVEATGEFLFQYHQAMIQAREKGKIKSFYRIDDEETSVCHVADMAGLMSKESTIYEPNYEKVQSFCVDSDPSHPARQPFSRKTNKVNKGQLSLGWNDLKGGEYGSKRATGDMNLVNKILDLFSAFGYDANLEQNDVSGEF